jgi:hypothetical protein
MAQPQTSLPLLWQRTVVIFRGLWQQRWFKLAATGAVAGFLLLLVVVQIVANRAQPLLRERVVATLTEKFHAPASLDALHISVLRGLAVEGSGLTIGSAVPQAAPLLSVKSFRFHVSLLDLLNQRLHVETLHVAGLELHVPPSQPAAPAAPANNSPVTASIGHILCTDAHIYLAPSQPGAAPLHFDVDNLDLKDLSTTTAIPYAADIVYARPAVRVHVAGSFGPWAAANPGATPLAGTYSTSTVDLSAIAGLGGKLTSSGQFSGELEGVMVDGKVASPNLALEEGAHPVTMDATFHLTVDGTTGDTTFAPIQVNLPRGQFLAQGTMHILPGEGPGSGPDIQADVTVPRGRIEELLEIGTNTRPTLMSGALALHAHLHVPPGPRNVEQKMQATGSLTVDGITMGDPKLQQSINSLSGLTRGNLSALRGVLPVGGAAAAPVTSNITATFALADGLMTVPSLIYTVPGSHVQLAGVYSLGRNAFEFKGHYIPGSGGTPQPQAARPAGKFSLGSLLSKAAPMLLKVTGIQVPVAITGAGGRVKLNVTDNADESTAQMAADLAHP